MVWKDPKQVLVIYCLQLLLVILLYPIPEDGRGAPPKNYYRHFFGRLHRPQDFQFLVDGMTRILNQPVCFIIISFGIILIRRLATSDNVLSTREPEIGQMGTRNDGSVLGEFAMQ